MKNQTWCPFCSHPNPYEIEKPLYCGKCGKNMTTAFTTVPLNEPKPPLMTTVAHEPPVVAPTPLRRPKPLYGTYEDTENDRQGNQGDDVDDHYSRDRVQARASQLAQSFGGAFNFSLADVGTTVRAGEILAPLQAQAGSQPQTQAKKTRARKAK